MPSVSVIIPTYQRANLVSQAIESVLAQTYTDYEIIVVNDGSQDNTKEVLAGFGDKISVINQDNLGVAAARNVGIMAAQGRYIALLDHDDIWLPTKLEKQIACLEANHKIGVVYSDIFYFNDKGIYPYTYAQKNKILPFEQLWSIFVRGPIPTCSVVVIRRECLDEVGLLDETLVPVDDYDLWFRIVEKWLIYFLNEPLVYYRRYEGQQSNNEEKMLLGLLRVKEKAFNRYKELQKLPLMVLDEHFFNGYLRVAYMYIQRYQGEKARPFLERYRQIRGININSEWLWMISFPILNPSSTSDSVSVTAQ
ncbi:glycosyltransferase family 2 protein [Iningainema tapete]|uniref:Glycosyltransferase n=1 Tax=Iningainema tapete BLCC-T55 TaxID=2748662 RepID=A0A8J7CAS5_9CYAN|nr:glycosyltransferase [Iningainema tapete]MBD2771540.1 glycosyltransferase [Iningainema tapete BLCC-T55]